MVTEKRVIILFHTQAKCLVLKFSDTCKSALSTEKIRKVAVGGTAAKMER